MYAILCFDVKCDVAIDISIVYRMHTFDMGFVTCDISNVTSCMFCDKWDIICHMSADFAASNASNSNQRKEKTALQTPL